MSTIDDVIKAYDEGKIDLDNYARLINYDLTEEKYFISISYPANDDIGISAFELKIYIDDIFTMLENYGIYRFNVHRNRQFYQEFMIKWDIWDMYNRDRYVKILRALMLDYNPIENYNKYSDIKNTFGDTRTESNTDPIENVTTNGERNGTDKTNIAAFDSTDYVDNSEGVSHVDVSTDKTNLGATKTVATSDEHIDNVKEHTHGNIGVMLSSTAIIEEMKARNIDIINMYIVDMINQFCYLSASYDDIIYG